MAFSMDTVCYTAIVLTDHFLFVIKELINCTTFVILI